MNLDDLKDQLRPLSEVSMSDEQLQIVKSNLRQRMSEDVSPRKQHRHLRQYMAIGASIVAVCLVATALLTNVVRLPGLGSSTHRTHPAVNAVTPKLVPTTLSSIQMVSGLDGWGTSNGHVLHTATGGAVWKDVTPPRLQGYLAQRNYQFAKFQPVTSVVTGETAFFAVPDIVVHQKDGSIEYVPEVFKTVDGGATWDSSLAPSLQSPGSGEVPVYLHFVSATHGWLVSQVFNNGGEARPDRTLSETSDGGKTWHIVAQSSRAETTSSGYIGLLPGMEQQVGAQWVDFLGNNAGLTQGQQLGQSGMMRSNTTSLYRTTDGGLTWNKVPISIPFKQTPSVVTFLEPGVFGDQILVPIVVKYNGSSAGDELLLAKSTDSGKTFSVINSLDVPPLTPSAYGDGFVNAQFGWMTVGNGLFMIEGQKITIVPGAPAPDNDSNVDFISSSVGFLISQELYETNDGGHSWTPIKAVQGSK